MFDEPLFIASNFQTPIDHVNQLRASQMTIMSLSHNKHIQPASVFVHYVTLLLLNVGIENPIAPIELSSGCVGNN